MYLISRNNSDIGAGTFRTPLFLTKTLEEARDYVTMLELELEAWVRNRTEPTIDPNAISYDHDCLGYEYDEMEIK